MAYFSNGSEAEIHEGNVCEHCAHWEKDEATQTWGCPVWDVHFIHNSDQHTDGKLNAMGRLLEMLIPNGGGDCKMHRDREEPAATPAAPDLLDALTEIRAVLRGKNSAISDTIWISPGMTMLDLVDLALAKADRREG